MIQLSKGDVAKLVNYPDVLLPLMKITNACFEQQLVKFIIGSRGPVPVKPKQGCVYIPKSEWKAEYDYLVMLKLIDRREHSEDIWFVEIKGAMPKKATLSEDEKNMYSEYVDFINETLGRSFRGEDTSKKQFRARLNDGYTIEELKKVVRIAKRQDYHRENGFKYLTPEFLTRSKKVEMFLGMSQKPVKGNWGGHDLE